MTAPPRSSECTAAAASTVFTTMHAPGITEEAGDAILGVADDERVNGARALIQTDNGSRW